MENRTARGLGGRDAWSSEALSWGPVALWPSFVSALGLSSPSCTVAVGILPGSVLHPLPFSPP